MDNNSRRSLHNKLRGIRSKNITKRNNNKNEEKRLKRYEILEKQRIAYMEAERLRKEKEEKEKLKEKLFFGYLKIAETYYFDVLDESEQSRINTLAKKDNFKSLFDNIPGHSVKTWLSKLRLSKKHSNMRMVVHYTMYDYLQSLNVSPFKKDYSKDIIYGILYICKDLLEKGEFNDDALSLYNEYEEKITKKTSNNMNHERLVMNKMNRSWKDIQDEIKNDYEIDKETRGIINGNPRINERLDYFIHSLTTIKEEELDGAASIGGVHSGLDAAGWTDIPEVRDYINKYTKYFQKLYNKKYKTAIHNGSRWQNKYEKYVNK